MKQLIINTIEALLNSNNTDTILSFGWSAGMPPTFNNTEYPIYCIKGIYACTEGNTLFLFPYRIKREDISKLDETYSISCNEDINSLLKELERTY